MNIPWFLHCLIAFVTATVITYLTGFIIRIVANKLGVIDHPNSDKLHQQPTPRLGGIAILLGFAISLVIVNHYWPLHNAVWIVLLGAAVTMIIGVIDDLAVGRGGVPPIVKLVILFLITYALSQFGIIVHFPFPYAINLLLTLIWIVGITSAFNAMDNMDGLASGLAFIAGVTFLAVANQTGQWTWGLLATALIGANLGFLGHNFYPAKLFMGDSGSFFLGFTLATLGIMGAWSTNLFKASLIPIIVLGLPAFDLVYTIIIRHRNGLTHNIKEIITYSSQDHFSHRIRSLGFSHKNTVLLIYLISICLSTGAFILRDTAGWEAVALFAQFVLTVCIVYLLISRLNRLIPPKRDPDSDEFCNSGTMNRK